MEPAAIFVLRKEKSIPSCSSFTPGGHGGGSNEMWATPTPLTSSHWPPALEGGWIQRRPFPPALGGS
uniref:Uncharacterized protein n=1 Tax=Oryza sativa subsp. japonica TaxID=39947 RepID=Q5Z9D4_ORYSJ|nr:hypothetical protein [Oryza sativa Japonica Group]